MRRYGFTQEDVVAFVVPENCSGADPDGNPIFVCEIRDIPDLLGVGP
jgi:hypothetical protein